MRHTLRLTIDVTYDIAGDVQQEREQLQDLEDALLSLGINMLDNGDWPLPDHDDSVCVVLAPHVEVL